ncbi:Fructosamine-3-kinase [Fodinibius salinus]|uniref:Fructosamine-3-kinase n=1 Tax=Fodinibius salinus TaxID=860790 RepID=A0A5D3YHJ9_9BACT|nr:fructosamine kinase family protein [Fodinibius salinus]TYP93374.1 Fructosamine-3-kinase [Fodinibius salinus]
MIPDSLRHHIQQTLDQEIVSAQRVSGGSINEAGKLTLSDGSEYFLKWNTTADPDMFTKEEKGLSLLKSANTGLRIPEVLVTGQTDSTGFLIQEFIIEGEKHSQSAIKFGQALANLHQQRARKFGLDHHNYIGRLPQSNTRHEDWISFFINERMKPQLQMAIDTGKLSSSVATHFKSMYNKLPNIFPDEEPSLLHGDLWGGNYFYDDSGQATIYDPAVYYGHREMELAFTHLFGGFSSRFYKAYKDVHPIEPEFDQRKDIYNLYPLLVHTNLFGGHYARQVETIAKQFL